MYANSQSDLKDNFKENFVDFCGNSSIHGLKYIGAENKNRRMTWIAICLALLCGCGALIHTVIGKWRESPLIFVLDQKMTPIDQIPFPAITYCPQRLPNIKRFNFSHYLHKFATEDFTYIPKWNVTDEELMKFMAFSKMCTDSFQKYTSLFQVKIHKLSHLTDPELYEIFMEYNLSPLLSLYECKGPCDDKLFKCGLRFRQIILKEGLCYTFNLQPNHEIFRDNVEVPLAEFPNIVPPDDEPMKSNFLKYFTNVNETEIYHVKSYRDRFYINSRMFKDFEDPACEQELLIFIHSPDEIPWDRRTAYILPQNGLKRFDLAVTPSVTQTNTDLRNSFNSEERDCYFEGERKLKFFKIYNKNNCELECMTNLTTNEAHGNCTMFWNLRIKGMKACIFYLYILQNRLERRSTIDEELEKCNCLPSCNSVEYSAKISGSAKALETFDTFDEEFFKTFGPPNGDSYNLGIQKSAYQARLYLAQNKSFGFEIPVHEAMQNLDFDEIYFDALNWRTIEIEIHFEKSEFIAMRRHLSYTFADFLSQIGGIMGCFLGISIFSMIEIIYFWTVRLFDKYRNARAKKMVGLSEVKVDKKAKKYLTVFPKQKIEYGRY